MRTWWIVKDTFRDCFMVLSDFVGPFYDNAIGPYWSYKEAMNVLHVWSK